MPEDDRTPGEDWLDDVREAYNTPPETPREEMWAAIEARIGSEQEQVISLDAERERRVRRRLPAWGWAAAAVAVLGLGIGLGRISAPRTAPPVVSAGAETGGGEAGVYRQDPDVFRAAAVSHLSATESLLTMVRADVRSGQVSPAVGDWSRNLLRQTRLLMDAQTGDDPLMAELLEDLELVLVQIVSVTAGSSADDERLQSEMTLALEGLQESEVLPRIQAVIPAGPRRFGT
jgi:hypothetical protein